jgi:purine-binding chemotaxis protein CheW
MYISGGRSFTVTSTRHPAAGSNDIERGHVCAGSILSTALEMVSVTFQAAGDGLVAAASTRAGRRAVASEHGASAPGHLISRAGGKLLALALRDVVEVLRPLPVSRLDGAPDFVLGAAVIRGAAVPVIDARSLLGAGPASQVPSRWISLRLGARRAALAVDEIAGTRALDDSSLQTMPPLLGSAVAGVAEAVGAVDAQLLLVLRAGKLVPEAVWDAIGIAERG